jgi:hypothetical protein
MNDSKSFNSSLSRIKFIDNVEEIISTTEIYIECLEENSKKFQINRHPSSFQMEEFLLEYINLEDKVLFCFDRLRNFKIKQHQKKKLEDLITNFNLSWRDYQDNWSDRMWEMYNNIRNEERLKLPADESVLSGLSELSELSELCEMPKMSNVRLGLHRKVRNLAKAMIHKRISKIKLKFQKK